MNGDWKLLVYHAHIDDKGKSYAFLINPWNISEKNYLLSLNGSELEKLSRFEYQRLQPGRTYDWTTRSDKFHPHLSYVAEDNKDLGLILRYSGNLSDWTLLQTGMFIRRSNLGIISQSIKVKANF